MERLWSRKSAFVEEARINLSNQNPRSLLRGSSNASELPPEISPHRGIGELESILGKEAKKILHTFYRFEKKPFNKKESDKAVFTPKSDINEEIKTIFGYEVNIEKSIHTKNNKDI